VVFAVLLVWSHFGVGMASVPSLPSAGVEDTITATVVPVADQTRLYLQCVDGAGDLWRASYLSSELSGPGSPDAAASKAICRDPARRVAD